MENKNLNEVKDLNERETDEIYGGFSPFVQERGYWVNSVCYKCKNEFRKYVVPTHKLTGRPSICPECMRKWREESKQKNPKFKVDVKKFLKEVEKINK